MTDAASNPSGWTILVLGAATLLVVCATRRDRSGGILGMLGLAGMIGGTIGAGLDGTLIPPAIIAVIASGALFLASTRSRGIRAGNSASTCITLAIFSGLLALATLLVAIALPTPHREPLIIFDAPSLRSEQGVLLEAARLDIELLLQRDLPRSEQAAREAQQWELLELVIYRRNRALELRESIAYSIARIATPGSPPPLRRRDRRSSGASGVAFQSVPGRPLTHANDPESRQWWGSRHKTPPIGRLEVGTRPPACKNRVFGVLRA